MKKLLGACFAVGLMISASACGGKKPAPAAPDNTMNNAGGDMGSGSGTGSGSGSGSGDMGAGAPCGGGGAPDPCGGGQ
jgi:hypothetical protein